MKLTTTSRNLAADAVVAQLNNGYLRLYTGAPPANPQTAPTGTLLAELRFDATAFGAAVNGVATANAMTADSDAGATGSAGWFRALKSNGTTAVYDGTVGTTGSDINMNSVNIQIHSNVSASGLTYTQPE